MSFVKSQMDDLFQKYKQRIEALNISISDKERIYNNMYNEIQFKLVNSFFNSLTTEQKKSIAEADSDEEAMRLYFNFINQSIKIPEFLHSIEKSYTEAMVKAVAELPEFP